MKTPIIALAIFLSASSVHAATVLTAKDFPRVPVPPKGLHTEPSSVVLHRSYLFKSTPLSRVGTCIACHKTSGLTKRDRAVLVKVSASRMYGGKPPEIPAPGAAFLFVTGLAGIAFLRRRKKVDFRS